MNIMQGLTHAKKVAGTRNAVVCGQTRYTWNEFEQRTGALARGLAALGVQHGDRVAVLMLNCHRYLELYYACARMGAVIVPLNIRLARPEIVFILNDSESKILVVDKSFAPLATGRDTFPSVEHVIYNGDETPEGMLNYEDVVSRGTQGKQSVDREMQDNDLAGLEAAVIGIPHEQWGEIVHAVVVCKSGMSVSSDELIVHVRTQIAGYKIPRSIEFRPEALPKSGAGKILKRDLREKYWAGKSRQVN